MTPTRDHAIAERAKNYRYSTNHQVVVVGRPLTGNRNDQAGQCRVVPVAHRNTHGDQATLGVVLVHREPVSIHSA